MREERDSKQHSNDSNPPTEPVIRQVTKRTRRPMTDDEKTNIALDRFAPLKQGRAPDEISILAARYDRDPSMITRAIAAAFKEGLVEFVSNANRPQVRRVEALEYRILRKFPKLWQAIVIETGPPPDDSEEDRRRFDDEVHLKLGYAMAKSIREWRLTDGARIGFGSGRAIYSLMYATTQVPPAIWLKDLHLVSLTGAVQARDYANAGNARMDADFHVCLFGTCVQSTATIHLAHFPITNYRDRESTCIGADDWERYCPTIAVVGVGVLAPGHRFVELANKTNSELNPIYKGSAPAGESRQPGKPNDEQIGEDALITPIRELVNECRTISDKYGFFAVMDLCNRLMAVQNPDVSPEEAESLQKKIKAVNDRLLNVTEDQLAQIPNLLIVAGGRRKAAALKQILGSEKLKVRFVCIDQELAAELVRDEMTPTTGWSGWGGKLLKNRQKTMDGL